jgi:hypothetical protein
LKKLFNQRKIEKDLTKKNLQIAFILVLILVLALSVLFVITGCEKTDKTDKDDGTKESVKEITLIGDEAYNNIEYYIGDSFPANQKIKVTNYDDTSTEISVTNDMLSGFDTTSAGKKTVTITYAEALYTFEITVYPEIENIIFDASSFKTQYNVNDELELGNYKIIVEHANSENTEITLRSEMIDGFSTAMSGNFTFLLKYRNVEFPLSYSVKGSFVLNDFKLSFNSINSTYNVDEYVGTSADVVVPTLINECKIGYIAPCIFQDSILNIKNLSLPFIGSTPTHQEGMLHLYDKYKLTDVNADEHGSLLDLADLTITILPGYITTIPENAFSGDRLVKKVVLSEDITEIGRSAFEASHITEITLPQSIKKIGQSAFKSLEYMKYLVIPDSVLKIESRAFEYSNILIQMAEGESIPDLDTNALVGVRGIIIPSSKMSIFASDQDWAEYNELFINTSSIDIFDNKYIVLTENNEKILLHSIVEFDVTDVVIPSDITEIGKYAFSGQITLESITFNSVLKKIDDYAFYKTGLKSAIIPSSVNAIGEYAFYTLYMPKFEVPATVTELGDNFYGSGILIMESITPVEGISFNNVKFIFVPAAAVGIYRATWSKLSNFICPDGALQSEFVMQEDSFAIYLGNGGNVVIPEGLREIGAYAFTKNLESPVQERSDITSITIAASIQKIGRYAFAGLTGLKTVIIKDNSLLTIIDEGAFYGCYNLETITFVDENILEEIHQLAFYNCKKLTNFDFADSIETIRAYAFALSGIREVEFSNESKLEEIYIKAFAYCYDLNKVKIAGTIEVISNDAFICSEKIEKIEIGVTKVFADKEFGASWSTKNYNGELHTIEYSKT